MSSATYRFLTLISVALLLGAAALHGQTAVTGGLTGYVADASGALISGATVEAMNTGTGVADNSVTNKDGVYRFSSLIPGTYTITIKKQGFEEFKREAVRIDAGTAVRIDASLPVGTVTSNVAVTGQAPILQTDSAEVSETLETQQVEQLPTFGRNISRLSLLAGGVSMPSGQLDLHPENAGEDFNVNINGASPNNNAHLLDGVENTEAIQGYSLIVTTQDSVQEVKMTTSNYDAEYGRVGGGVLQITTKSGTNSLHGSLFEYYRTAGFFAADHFSQPNGVPGNRWNQFGGSLGGAIKKDKLFFFADYQGMRNNLHTSSLYTTPIDAFKAGDFSSIADIDPIYDPTTGNPDGSGRTQISCDGVLNVICPGLISNAATNLLALLPEPNFGPPGATDNNYQISRPATFDQNQVNGRIDYFVTPKTVVFGKFSYFGAKFFTDNVFGPVGGGPPLGGAVNSGNSFDHDKSAMFDYQHTFSPSLLQDFRFAFSRIYIQELQLDASSDEATQVGIPDINLGTVYTSGLPQLNFNSPIANFAMGDFGLPFFETETNFQFFDNWTKTVGRHSFKFGGEVSKFFGIRTDVSGRGIFNFNQAVTQTNEASCLTPASGTFCGSGLAAFELGLPSSFNRDITLVQPQEKQWKYGFYGQDTWQVTPRLTLTLGLRWDYLSPIFTPDGQSVGNINLTTDNIELTNLAGKYAGVTTPKTEFSPRLGLSFRLPHETVLRGGYGRSYFQNPYGAAFGTQGGGWPIKQSQTDSPVNPFQPLDYTIDEGPGLPAQLPPYPPNGLISFFGAPGGSEYFPGTGTYPHSYTDTYNVSLEHAFPHELTVAVAYVGNIGRHLWDNVDVNAPVPGPDVGGSFNPNRPYFASYGWAVDEYQRNNRLAGYPELRSNYNSLQIRLNKRFHQGLFITSNFTWDKSLDKGTFGPTNIFNFDSNYGNSDFTRPWSFISAANWDLPFGRGRAYGADLSPLANAIFGGWAISGIFNFEAGNYFTPYLANNSTLNSVITLRPDRIGSGKVSNPNRNRWFNPADFTVPALYTYGDSGRNILLGPGFGSVDLSLSKSVSITERMKLEFRWDAFNAFNRVNLGGPNSYVDTSTAGQITSIVDFRRRMQIGAHLRF
jgi:outer membrane receptor protein involved in Fe transport